MIATGLCSLLKYFRVNVECEKSDNRKKERDKNTVVLINLCFRWNNKLIMLWLQVLTNLILCTWHSTEWKKEIKKINMMNAIPFNWQNSFCSYCYLNAYLPFGFSTNSEESRIFSCALSHTHTHNFILFYFIWLCPQRIWFPGPGIEPMTQQTPKPLQWQHQITLNSPLYHKGTL